MCYEFLCAEHAAETMNHTDNWTEILLHAMAAIVTQPNSNHARHIAQVASGEARARAREQRHLQKEAHAHGVPLEGALQRRLP